jgi:exonuclease SbcD
VVRGTLAEVLAAADGPGREDWLQVVLTDRPYGAMASLRERYPAVLDLRFETAVGSVQSDTPAMARIASDPIDTLAAFWAAVGAGSLTAKEREAAITAIAAAQQEGN